MFPKEKEKIITLKHSQIERIYNNLLLICVLKRLASRNRSVFTSSYSCASAQPISGYKLG